MGKLRDWFDWIDKHVTRLMARYGILLLRISLGIVFFWFGALNFFPDLVFLRIPYAPTLEGQYIIENLVLISAGLVVGATVRGGWLVSDPPRTAESE